MAVLNCHMADNHGTNQKLISGGNKANRSDQHCLQLDVITCILLHYIYIIHIYIYSSIHNNSFIIIT